VAQLAGTIETGDWVVSSTASILGRQARSFDKLHQIVTCPPAHSLDKVTATATLPTVLYPSFCGIDYCIRIFTAVTVYLILSK
jgi:hypothetical protein